MKKTLHIIATIDQPQFLEDMVEKLANRHYDLGFGREKMPSNQEALETSSTESYVGGTITMYDSGEQIDMPFVTRFVFTCIKGKDSVYKLGWSFSLS